MYLLELRREVSQGDIFDDIPLPVVEYAGAAIGSGTIHEVPGEVVVGSTESGGMGKLVPVRMARILMVSHDCEYDKPSNPFVTVAEVRPMSEVDTGSQGNIRQFRVRSTFYLPANEPHLPESYVDLRRMAHIDKRFLAARAASSERLLSLSEEARLALQRQIAIFFGVDRAG